jgi:hypothetical protein
MHLEDLILRPILILASLAFLWVAVQGLFEPAGLASTVGLELVRPGATNEIRASYGGQSLAIALMLAHGAWRPDAARPALVLLTGLCSGLVLGRTVDAVLNGLPPAFVLGLWVAETVMAVMGAFLLGRHRRS